MTTTFENDGAIRFRQFQAMLTQIQADAAETARFNAAVQGPSDLIRFSAEKGVIVTEAEAQGIFQAAHAALLEAAGARHLDDAELDQVAGGVSWAAVGGMVGVIAGVALGTMAAPALAGGIVALQSAQFIGMAVGSAAAGGLSGGVWGGAIGGAAEAVSNLFKG